MRLDRIHYLDKECNLSVGTMCLNYLQACPLVASKDWRKQPTGSFDYKIDNNSDICIVKWNNKNVIRQTSNVVAIYSIQNVLQWNNSFQAKEEVDCPNIVMQYNKSIDGVELVHMLLTLYRITVKTRH